MEILAAFVGAVVGGLISWLGIRWQYQRQSADIRQQLSEQTRLSQVHARAEIGLRIQIETYQALREFDGQVFRNLIEVSHDAGHLIDDVSDEYYRRDIGERIGKVRRLIRGESRSLGGDAGQALLAATDYWKAFLEDPQPNLRVKAEDATYKAHDDLRRLIDDRGRMLGVEH